MNRSITVWGREFELKVVFDVYEGEEILNIQKEALDEFLEAAGSLLSSYSELENYCLNRDAAAIGDKIDNIFKYVMPKSIFVKRDDKKHVVALICDYRFDEEHGLALIFENEKLVRVVTQDNV